MSSYFRSACLVLSLVVMGLSDLYAQRTDLFEKVQYSNTENGKVRISQNDDIEKLVDMHLKQASKSKTIHGYRIRIFSDSGPEARKEVNRLRAGFSDRYPDVTPHFLFDYPFYRIYVGDFRTRSEALKFLKEIEPIYPNAFVVRTRINYPKIVTGDWHD